MQGVRRAQSQLGDTVAVIGLGILGQLTAQLLRTAGCHVIGIDTDSRRLEIAKSRGLEFGILAGEDVARQVDNITSGHGADITIITAASRSAGIIQQSMELTRKKGRVVLVGAVGMSMERSPFYEKEIDFVISCSYGPGRYDSSYEQSGLDYPFAYVRWTENRNMQEFLRLLAMGSVDIGSIIEREYSIDQASEAYNEIQESEDKPLGVVLRYREQAGEASDSVERLNRTVIVGGGQSNGKIRLAIVGAGNFVRGTHLPNLKKMSDSFDIHTIVTGTGAKAVDVAEQFAATRATTDFESALDDQVDAVLIGTRHHLHAEQVALAIKAGKHVYCEKPLALTQQEIDSILDCYDLSDETLAYDSASPAGPVLMVGFNRRFAKSLAAIKKVVDGRTGPIAASYRVNAGRMPNDHWTQGPQGGGRIRGETCHMFDVFDYLVGHAPVEASVQYLQSPSDHRQSGDHASFQVRYADGSVCQLMYVANGSSKMEKEYLEVFCDDLSFQLNDYKILNSFGAIESDFQTANSDKGHVEALREFARGIRTGRWPISIGSLISTSRLTISLAQYS